MSNLNQLTDVIAAIYDTMIDASRWPAALEKTAAFVGAKASTLALHDTASAVGNVAYVWGDKPEYTKLYTERLAAINPVMVPMSLNYESGEVFSVSQVIPYNERRCLKLLVPHVMRAVAIAKAMELRPPARCTKITRPDPQKHPACEPRRFMIIYWNHQPQALTRAFSADC